MASSLNIVLKTVFVLIALSFTSCKKDKVPEPCTGVTLEGEETVYVGKWQWYKTRIRQWFDIGTDYFYDVTPSSEGFEYYCLISSNGIFEGYRNDTLVDRFILSSIEFEQFTDTIVNGMTFNLDCSVKMLNISHLYPLNNSDSIRIHEYPIKFTDEVAKKQSVINFLVRE